MKQFALGLPPQVKGFSFVESHARGDKLHVLVAEFRRAGWVCTASEAVQSLTSESGTYGGCFSGLRSHVLAHPLPDVSWHVKGFWSSLEVDLVGWELPLQNESLLVFGSYHRGGPVSLIF